MPAASFCIATSLMTKKPWTTPDQRTWLENLIPAFVEAQENKTTGTTFFPETYEKWQKKWPVEPPTMEELAEAGGEAPKALARKTKVFHSA